MTNPDGFIGAKAAFFCGPNLLVYQRDDFDGLPWRGLWDLPGGGREGDETPEECLLRELEEEFGLRLTADRLTFRRMLPSMMDAARQSWFFGGVLSTNEVKAIRFGNEGQRWEMMGVAAFLAHPAAVPQMQDRVRMVVKARPDWAAPS